MRLLERPVEFLLLQSEVPTDHDGAATSEISEKKRTNRILSFVTSQTIALIILLYIDCAIFCNVMFVKMGELNRLKLFRYNLIVRSE